jgi:pyridoxine kinase
MSSAPMVDAPAYGAGDLFASVYLARYLEDASPSNALELATSAVHAVFVETARLQLPELALIPAQAMLADPPRLFAAKDVY